MRGFTSRGIAVVLEMAQNHWSPAFKNVSTMHGVRCRGVGMPSWLYRSGTTMLQAERAFYANAGNVQDELAGVWRELAARYARNPMVVGFDMMNEPYTRPGLSAAALHLNALYTRLGQAIRAVNAHALLIFQDDNVLPGHGNTFALTRPPPFSGSVYELHLYSSSWNPSGLAKVRAYLARANAWRVPLWIGEFDAFGYASPFTGPSDWQTQLRGMMSFCKRNGIGWSEFAYAPKWFLFPGTDLPRPELLQTLHHGV